MQSWAAVADHDSFIYGLQKGNRMVHPTPNFSEEAVIVE